MTDSYAEPGPARPAAARRAHRHVSHATASCRRRAPPPRGRAPPHAGQTVFRAGGFPPEGGPLPAHPTAAPRRSAHSTRKCTGRRSARLNAGQIRRLYPFPPHRFHVLFNSLFKVLCNFPSRYLFAIGFVVLFSLRWSLPPALGCVPKQPDSEPAAAAACARLHRPCTFCGAPLKGDLGRAPATGRVRLYATAPGARTPGFSAGRFPVHSPLLRESWLVSFPLLTDMLKFSRCSHLSSGRCWRVRLGARGAGASHSGTARAAHDRSAAGRGNRRDTARGSDPARVERRGVVFRRRP